MREGDVEVDHKQRSPQSDNHNGEEHEELMNMYVMNARGLCYFHDFLFLAFVVGVGLVIWVFVYRQPIPMELLKIMGMDDTIYPEMVEKKHN